MGESRIENHPILEFSGQKRVTFYFEGKELEGIEGEPVAAALHAAGVKVLRHSAEMDRPRGFFCAIGNCSACLMRVNDRPNVRTCTEPLREGMRVERQRGKGELNA